MGLNVSALRLLERFDFIDESTKCESDVWHLSAAETFEKQTDGVAEGYYRAHELAHIDGMSCTYYNRWRERLAELVDVDVRDVWNDPNAQGPFFELINFSDCEGFIGPKTAKKLASDFEMFKAKARSEEESDPFGHYTFGHYYEQFRLAFKAAADAGGVVRFG